jgi:response regulator NasT
MGRLWRIILKDTMVLIDDEPITRMNFCEIFEEAGYKIVGQASDGYDAIVLCRATKPDIVMMDVKMPVFDGLSAAETIIGEELCDCVILVTAYSSDDFIDRAKKAGIMSYLVKPLDEKVLLPAVSISLSKSREFKRMKEDLAGLSRDIGDQKVIEQAKGIMAKMNGTSETEAYVQLRKMSMDKRRPIPEIARYMVQAHHRQSEPFRAKELLMKKYCLSEPEAFAQLKALAQTQNCSLDEAALDILKQ